MNTAIWNDQPLSRMMLGTVQFGMPYGVANRTGQPEYSDVLAILKTAFEGGINALDTAAAYGSSEAILGRALRELGVANRIFVVTKIRPLTPHELADSHAAYNAIEESVYKSLRLLRLETLPAVLFHRESDALYGNVLLKLRQKGLVRDSGVSCNNFPGPAAGFVSSGHVSALQIPGNILDRRHQESGIFTQAAANGIAVFIRSVYLQGLLLMPEEEISAELQGIIPWRRQLAAIASQAGMQMPELALRFMLSQPGVTSILTGVETLAQMHENLTLFNRGPLSEDLLSAIDSLALKPDEFLITPGQWQNANR